MGIGDRHEDNMMLWYGGGTTAPLLYFQLDFKHVFGNQVIPPVPSSLTLLGPSTPQMLTKGSPVRPRASTRRR